MNLIKVKCAFCGKEFFKTRGRINEVKKSGWKTYCSIICQGKAKNKQQLLKCSNPKCNNVFKRKPSDIRSSYNYCSRSCAVVVNNSKVPKRKKIIIKARCKCCGKKFIQKEQAIYCSRKCKDNDQIINNEEILKQIRDFYKRHNQIPLKREFAHYDAARGRFGTWNKAIEAAGFEPNPVMFAKKHIANDGHKCDSFAEKIIDDWLASRKIKHERSVSYPKDKSLTVDFVIGHNWVEFFGLAGVINDYDKLIKKKRRLCEKANLPLIEIYPKDLFPVNNLLKILKFY